MVDSIKAMNLDHSFSNHPPSFRDGPKDQTSDVQLHIGESRDSGFDASHRPGMTESGRRAPQRRKRAIAPAMICMATPTTHPAMIIVVQAICGSWRSTIKPTDAKAEPVARNVPTALKNSALSIFSTASPFES